MLSDLDYKELVRFRDGSQRIEGAPSRRLQLQIDARRLEAKSYLYFRNSYGGDECVADEWELTPAGEDALLEYEKERRQQEQAARAEKADRKFQLLNTLLGAAIGCALTLLAEHFDVLLKILRALFP